MSIFQLLLHVSFCFAVESRRRLEVFGNSDFEQKVACIEHAFKGILTGLLKPGRGEFGKFYSLLPLNDPRIAIRNCDNFQVTKEDVEKIIDWKNTSLKQDFTGVPAVVDLACMCDAMNKLGNDSNKINPLVPVDLVIDHSVQVDVARTENAVQANMGLEFQRNKERFAFLKWGSNAFQNMLVVPPGSGPMSMVLPGVVVFELSGKLRNGVTATYLVLTVTQMLRKHGVVGKFVEFQGEGVGKISLADKATIANMSPEYGATMGFFPVDNVAMIEAYLCANNMFVDYNERPHDRAITSCTNTSNPSVMLGPGLVAKKACELGLQVKSWIKTSIVPGSVVVTKYLLQRNIVVAAVLSGNWNFEGCVHPLTRANYLASLPLVVAYALARTVTDKNK
ncbi:unnamed protein product [Camellia sinensis]